MNVALDRPTLSAVVTQWTLQPVAVIVIVLLALAYVRAVRAYNRRPGPGGRAREPWPVQRSVVFGVGLAAIAYLTCGFFQVYGSSLYWAWTTQTLVIWLFVPLVVLWGRPLQLARALSGSSGRLERTLRSRPALIISNPLVGPALVPILSAGLFFGPLPGWAIESAPVGWVLQIVLLAVGALMVLPLIGLDEEVSSLAVGFSLAIGSVELVIDAVPGIALRLNTHLVSQWFDHRSVYGWSPHPLRDQQLAGGVLWTVAELIDLPFLFLVYRRWLRADARDAAKVDAVLEAERHARAAMASDGPDAPLDPETFTDRDVPWWVSDPAMQQRLRRRG